MAGVEETVHFPLPRGLVGVREREEAKLVCDVTGVVVYLSGAKAD